MNTKAKTLLLIAGVLAASTRDAAAYVDPGSGSYLFQLLIAGLTALVFFFSSIKQRVASLTRRILRRKESASVMEDISVADAVKDPVSREF